MDSIRIKKLRKFIKGTTLRNAVKIGPLAFVDRYLFPAMRREHGIGFLMSTWYSDLSHISDQQVSFDGVVRSIPACKSIMCIGGTMSVILGIEDEGLLAKALGLTYDQAQPLFYGWIRTPEDSDGGWPASLGRAFREAKTALEKERIAEVVILRAIQTKGACFFSNS